MPQYKCRWCGRHVDRAARPEKCPACGYTGLIAAGEPSRHLARGGGKPAGFRAWPVFLFAALGILFAAPLAGELARDTFGQHEAIEEIVWRARALAVVACVLLGLALAAWRTRRD